MVKHNEKVCCAQNLGSHNQGQGHSHRFIPDKSYMGRSGGATFLGKLPGPGRPTIWMTVGQGSTALTVGAGVGVVWTFVLSSIFSLLFLPLSGRRPDID